MTKRRPHKNRIEFADRVAAHLATAAQEATGFVQVKQDVLPVMRESLIAASEAIEAQGDSTGTVSKSIEAALAELQRIEDIMTVAKAEAREIEAKRSAVKDQISAIDAGLSHVEETFSTVEDFASRLEDDAQFAALFRLWIQADPTAVNTIIESATPYSRRKGLEGVKEEALEEWRADIERVLSERGGNE